MKFKKYLTFLFKKRKQTDSDSQKVASKRRFRLTPFIFLITFLALIGLTFFLPNTFVKSAMFFRGNPKPITQSSQTLPVNIQKAIENLAQQRIKEEQAVATLPVNISINATLTETSGPSIQPLIDSFVSIIGNPAEKAKARLARVDRLIRDLVNVLTKDKSDQAISSAVGIIQDIGRETDAVVTDKDIQTNRDILRLLIEQYNRLQLIIQQLEDRLPIKAYLEIEQARQKYLVVTATASINQAPNLDAVHNIALKEVERVVGKDFSELKAIEIISDFEAGLNPKARQKLIALQKQLALEFEKKMLKLPRDVRNRKLQDFINYSYGNPLNQTESFEQMKNFISDREMILELDSLKQLALKRLEDRVFEIYPDQIGVDSQILQNKFLDLSLRKPEDLKILAQLKLDVLASKDESHKKKIADLEKISLGKVIEVFGNQKTLDAYFSDNLIKNSDLLAVSVVSQLSDILNSSFKVSTEAKSAIKNIKQKTLQNFAANIRKANFTTQEKFSYNPVSENADVRLLFPAPQGALLLESVKNDLDNKDKPVIAIAQRSLATLISRKPEIFTKSNQQKLYEKVQQIAQSIFAAQDQTDFEKQLPRQLQKEVASLKKTLGDRSIPKIVTPPGVTLPKIAKLPDNVGQGIILAAKARIKNKEKSQDAKLDLTVQAKDLGVSNPIILPDNPLYKIKSALRLLQLAVTFDSLQKAELLIQQDNQKTLEAAELIRQNSSLITVNKSLEVLLEIQNDFSKLKAHVKDFAKLKEKQPKKVDELISRIVANGLARQTVFSAIEEKVYGEDFVRIEKIRTSILKDGIDTLLQLADGDAKILAAKLEQAVNAGGGSKFKELKAIELLVEIKRFQPEKIGLIIAASQTKLIKKFEAKILEMDAKDRNSELLSYTRSFLGNPVRQFEALDNLKKDFTNPQTKLLTEALKDKAVENLTDRISEITSAESQKEFVNSIVGNKPEDLKIVTEIAIRVEEPQRVGQAQTPIEQKVNDIKAAVEENIINTYKDDALALAQTDFVKVSTPDVIDVKVAKELSNVLSRTPEVASDVVALAQKTEDKITNQFEVLPATAIDILVPVPQVLTELAQLKNEAPTASEKAKIDVAIKEEVKLIKEHLVQVSDPSTAQTYIAQITNDPVVAKVVGEVGGKDFTQILESKTQEIQATTVSQETILQTTVTQVQQEIFQAPVSSPSTVEQTLPQAVQEEIKVVKAEVPQEQIPQVTVSVTVNAPVSVPVPEPTSQPPSAPAPAIQAPVENKPVEQPAIQAAPAAPGL